MEKRACFIGHRKINDTVELKERLREAIIMMIKKENVTQFLFGSKSEFDTLCHLIVSELQKDYPKIKRIAYTCKSEIAVDKTEKKEIEKNFSNIFGQEIYIKDYDEEYEFLSKYTSGKASYVERNRAMINDSNFCIFYYDELYNKDKGKSGTKIAYDYAIKKKKKVINIFLQ